MRTVQPSLWPYALQQRPVLQSPLKQSFALRQLPPSPRRGIKHPLSQELRHSRSATVIVAGQHAASPPSRPSQPATAQSPQLAAQQMWPPSDTPLLQYGRVQSYSESPEPPHSWFS
jgi:hypothetical protein